MLQALHELLLAFYERLGISQTSSSQTKHTLLHTACISILCIASLSLGYAIFWAGQSIWVWSSQSRAPIESVIDATKHDPDKRRPMNIATDAPYTRLYELPNAKILLADSIFATKPYPLAGSLADNTNKLMDLVVMQAFIHLAIPHERIFPFAIKQHEQTPYLFQRIQIHTDKPIGLILDTLAAPLGLWVANAKIRLHAEHTLLISVDDTITHAIYVLPTTAPFFMPPKKGEPRLSIVMDDLGESIPKAKRLLRLGIPITFSIWPHSTNAREVASMAHAAGHEIFIHQPMEPMRYPAINPGKDPLLVNMTAEAITKIIQNSIRKVPFATGLNNHMGSRFTRNKASSSVVLDILSQHAYTVLDSLTHPRSIFADVAHEKNLDTFERTLFLDDSKDIASALQNLYRAERIAQKTGFALVIGHPKASTLKALETWVAKRNTAIHIVPLRYQKPFKPAK